MRTILLSILLSACTSDWGHEGVVLIPQSGDAAWPAAVQLAADEWNLALEARCGFVAFEVGEMRIAREDEHPVQLIPVADWPHAGLAGALDGNKIVVKAGFDAAQTHHILRHELGHALGLGHVTTPSVMNDSVWGTAIQPADVDAVAALVGCL